MCSETSKAETEDELQPTEQDDGSVMEHQVDLNRHNNHLPEGVEETNWLDQACNFTQDNGMSTASATSSTKPLKENNREQRTEIGKPRNFYRPRKKEFDRKPSVEKIIAEFIRENENNIIEKPKKNNQIPEKKRKEANTKITIPKDSNGELQKKFDKPKSNCRRLEKDDNEKKMIVEKLNKQNQQLQHDTERMKKMEERITRLEKEIKEKETINRQLNEENQRLKMENKAARETRTQNEHLEKVKTLERRNDEITRHDVDRKSTNERLERKRTNIPEGSPLKARKVLMPRDGTIDTSACSLSNNRRVLHQPPIQEQSNLPFVFRSQGKPDYPLVRHKFTCPASCGTICAFFVFGLKCINLCFPKFMKIIAHTLTNENQGLAMFNCSDSLKVFSFLRLITMVSEENDILGEDQLNGALQKVTQKCKDYVGLLTLGYSDREAGHCVVFFKKNKGRMIEVYDPQTEQWWVERREDYCKINKVQCFEVNVEMAKQYLKQCDRKLCSLECGVEHL